MIRILLVDDQPLVLSGLRALLDLDDGLQIVATCADGSEVVPAVRVHRPDVVVMDVRMKQVGGPEATRALGQEPDPPPVLILTTFDDDEVVAAALSAGAAGFVLKEAPGEDIIRATREVAAGRSWLDPAVTGRVLAHLRTEALPRAAAGTRLDELTPRELDVLRLLADGTTNTEIATQLHIGETTVKSHLGSIFTKLQLRDRAAAIVFAYEHGIVTPGGQTPR
ncbi:response regulator transcription factor [Nitriliruptor alkaliphilus]|uniref:response regulator transcription factor n=1 Tax=Nitriliruptor alkaliphilus TaxID=427918 RepID=UPI000A8552FE|nr:response regulator transcription factor [Nitriliruptor alkaliphilus]